MSRQGEENTPSRTMLYPPVGVAHVSQSLLDFIHPLEGQPAIKRVVVSTAAQLNSAPHIGTITTTLCTFAMAKLIIDGLGIDTTVLFDSLDNAPARTESHDGVLYQVSLEDQVSPIQGQSLSEYYFSSLRKVLDWASRESRVSWSRRTYSEFQASAAIRRRVLTMAQAATTFGRLTNPAAGRLHLRIRCPTCRLIDKTSAVTKTEIDSTGIVIRSMCPRHGDFDSPLTLDKPDHIDLNTPIRDITKCAEFIDWRSTGCLVIMLDGGDWGGSWAWEVVMKALAWLGEDLKLAPTRLFTPLILDESGAKVSKSLYVGSDAYQHLPQWIMDLVAEPDSVFAAKMSELWELVLQWIHSPARFFRNYALTAIL